MSNISVLNQIDIIENRKKVLVELRESVEAKVQQLYDSSKAKDNPNDSDALLAFYSEAEKVKKEFEEQDKKYLKAIRDSQAAIEGKRISSGPSLELKVDFGTFDTFSNGWRFHLKLMNETKVIYKKVFVIGYENLVKKPAANINSDKDDEAINEYVEIIQKFNQLIPQDAFKLRFDLDYSVSCSTDDHDSEYEFYFETLHIYENYDKLIQDEILDERVIFKSTPAYSIKPITGIVEREQKRIALELSKRDIDDFCENLNVGKMVRVNGTDKIKPFEILTTPVTQNLYEKIMIENPSTFKGERHPVEMVSWYDAIVFCNRLSEVFAKDPCYSINGDTNTDNWNYIPHIKNRITQEIVLDESKNGFRLPTQAEWILAANGGLENNSLTYAGSNHCDDVAWFFTNSEGHTHDVATKAPNSLGLYDMSGNVWEWCWDCDGKFKYNCGGSWRFGKFSCQIVSNYSANPYDQSNDLGFRYICNAE